MKHFNMNRFITMILTVFMTLGFTIFPTHADVIGEVIATDITAYIDEQPIASFNINGFTYVIAEDLRSYGFTVLWDENARTLRIYRSAENDRWFMPASDLNVKKSDIARGARVYDVYSTDIVTYLDDVPITGYNVNGQTLIQIDELTRYGYFNYDDGRREVKLDMAPFWADAVYETSAKETLSLPCDKIEGTITYSGDVQNSMPNGYGRVTETYEFTIGLVSTDTSVYTAYFKDGQPDGLLYRYDQHIPHNGSDRRVRETYQFEQYKDGQLDGYYLHITLYDGFAGYRTEGIYESGKQVYTRVTEYDDTYRYGYRVTKEGYLDALGNIIDYEKTDAGKIVSVSAQGSGSYAIDEYGALFAFGETFYGAKTVPVKIDENIAFASGGSGMCASVIDFNANLYYLYDKVITYQNTDVPIAAQNVKSASEEFFLTNDGQLYIKPVDYSWTWYDAPTLLDSNVVSFSSSGQRALYVKENGDVYYAIAERPGVTWGDGYTLTEPVKVFGNAKAASCNNRFLVVQNDNTLWGWSSPYYGTEYEDPYGVFTTTAPIQIATDVVLADSGTNFLAYLKTDGSLWVSPDVTEPENEMLFDLTEPVKLSDRVASFSCGGSYLLFVTEDGALYSWGKNSYGRLGNGTEDDAQTPYPITEFYALRK